MNSVKLSVLIGATLSVAVGTIAYAWSKIAHETHRSWWSVAMETVDALKPIGYVWLFLNIAVIAMLAIYWLQALKAEAADDADEEEAWIPKNTEDWKRSIPAEIATAECTQRGSDVLVVLHTPEGPVTFPAHELVALADRRGSRDCGRLMYWINSNMPSPAATSALSH